MIIVICILQTSAHQTPSGILTCFFPQWNPEVFAGQQWFGRRGRKPLPAHAGVVPEGASVLSAGVCLKICMSPSDGRLKKWY